MLIAHRSASALLLVVCSALVFINALDNGFQYDDRHSIVENPHIRELGNIGAFFSDPTFFSRDADKAMYRPLLLVTLALNYAWSGYEPYSYHLVSWALHALGGLLVWGILLCAHRPPCLALLGGLLFVVHPLCSEPVNYISSRSELLAAVGALAALWLYMRSAQTSVSWSLALSLLCFAGGLLAKSVAIVAPVWLVVWDVQRGAGLRWRRYLPYGVVALGYLALVRQALARAVLSEPVRALDVQLATQVKALAYYVYLAWAPIHLSVDHAFAESGPGDPLVWLALLALMSGVVLALCNRSEYLGLVLALSALLPTLIVPLNVLVNEHRLYLPVAGLAIALTGMRGLERVPGMSLGAPLMLCLLSAMTLQRNVDWRDEFSLWSAAHRTNPRSVRPLVYMGNAARADGNADGARTAYRKALDLDPHNAVALAGLGGVFMDGGQMAQSIALYDRALQAQPQMTDLHYSLARALQEDGRLFEARAHYAALGEDSPHRPIALNNIGTTFELEDEVDSALTYYRRAAAGGAIDGRGNLERLVGRLVGQAEQAVEAGDWRRVEWAARAALRGHDGHIYARFFLSVSLLQQGRGEESITENERLLRAQPDFDEGWLQLANAYETVGRPDRARAAYQQLIDRGQRVSMQKLAQQRLQRLQGRVEGTP